MKELSVDGWLKSGREALHDAARERTLDDSFPESECEPLTPESEEHIAIPTHEEKQAA